MTWEDAPDAGLDARDATRLRALECIRAAGRISRTDIARALELSPGTVTSACAALLEAGMLRETPADPPASGVQRGRPRVMLEVEPDAFAIAGLKVARDVILVGIVDFQGRNLGAHQHPLARSCMSAEALAEEIRHAMDGACAALGVAPGRIAGASVGLPGFVNAATRFVHWSSSVIERNVDFGPIFARALPCPVFIDNDANLVAKAEQLFGAGRGARDFLVVTIEHGVGMGIVLDGRLHRGARGIGGEFGHMKVQIGGALCQCGQRGCLEAYVGDYALLRDAPPGPGGAAPTLRGLFAAAAARDPAAQEVLDRASRVLGLALANLVNLFDPERIVLARSRPPFEHPYSDTMLEALRRNTVQVDAPLPEITVRNLDEMMWARGAAAHGVEMVSILKIRELGAADAA